jgi:hypothetical protein
MYHCCTFVAVQRRYAVWVRHGRARKNTLRMCAVAVLQAARFATRCPVVMVRSNNAARLLQKRTMVMYAGGAVRLRMMPRTSVPVMKLIHFYPPP